MYQSSDSAWDLGGEAGTFSGTTSVDLRGGFANGSRIDVLSDGRVYHRSTSTVSGVSAVAVSSGTTADMSGLIELGTTLALDAATFSFGSTGLWDQLGMVSVLSTGSSTTQFQGDITNGGTVEVTVAGRLAFGSTANIVSNGDVTLDTAGRFDGSGLIQGNVNVAIDSASWKLFSTHDFGGNVDCTIDGMKVGSSVAPVGCTPI